jgi:hypothetical protein
LSKGTAVSVAEFNTVIDEGAIEIAQAILLLRIFSRKSQRYGGNSVARFQLRTVTTAKLLK